jgi:hypothetical protein
MTQPQHPSLAIADLPLRSQSLSNDDLTAVFGGCQQRGDSCDKDSDCCNQRTTVCTWDGVCR